jgi:hypothetical protein
VSGINITSRDGISQSRIAQFIFNLNAGETVMQKAWQLLYKNPNHSVKSIYYLRLV